MSAPELELTEVEAQTVAQNIVAVARHYDLQATAKATDWGNLIVSIGVVYAPRIARVAARKGAENRARRPAPIGHNGGPPLNAGGFTAPINNPTANKQGSAPPTHMVQHPKAAGLPGGAGPLLRPKLPSDEALLNEIEPALY